ncbi:MAG: trypsin-like peptidase domain-containing protein [Thermoleophilia bacterium]
MKRLMEIVMSLAAGLAGAVLFFIVALSLHWGGLGQQAGTVTIPAATPEVSSIPVSAGGFAGPEQVYSKYADSVVQIVSTFEGQGSGLYHSSQSEQGIGSGFVASADGYILTNAHVVTSDTTQQAVKASDIEVKFKNGKTAKASIVGYDLTSSDVAVIKIDPQGLDLVPVMLGDSDAVKVGESVYAIGSPFGVYASTMTAGIVSATKRTVESPEAGFTIQDAIQTDAAINRGNSGGPLFNSRSEVVGLNEQIATVSGGSEGVGFAVPINTAKKVMEQIIANGGVEYAWMGVVGQSVDQEAAKRLNLTVDKGALISEVQAGGPSEKAGLKSSDVIVKIDGQEVASMENVTSILVTHRPGDKVRVTYVRASETSETDVELGKRPERL